MRRTASLEAGVNRIFSKIKDLLLFIERQKPVILKKDRAFCSHFRSLLMIGFTIEHGVFFHLMPVIRR